jgi:DNA-binding Lrp family transcriptional regulator
MALCGLLVANIDCPISSAGAQSCSCGCQNDQADCEPMGRTIVTVVLEREDGQTIRDLMARIAQHPQVIDCSHVTGETDFIVRMVA